jgi:hypothetical protein
MDIPIDTPLLCGVEVHFLTVLIEKRNPYQFASRRLTLYIFLKVIFK